MTFHDPMFLLDVILRYSTVALLLLITALAVRDARNFKPTIYIVLTCVTCAALLLGTVPDLLKLPAPIHAIVRIADIGCIVFVWWLGLSLFQDEFRLKWWHWGVLIFKFAALTPSRLADLRGDIFFPLWMNRALDLVVVAIMLHLIVVALKGRSDDLIEPRRRLRLYFVIAMIAVTLLSVLAENVLMTRNPEFLLTLRVLIIFPLALWGALWLTKFQPENFVFENPAHTPQTIPDIDPRDILLLEQLKTSMETEKAYTEPGLTIRTLGEKLGTPEHRLRALINQGLGYRNFSAFLNTYRIKAVKEAFAKPENSRIPVLTIAMDVGFNSLAPFNRAFKQSEGMTPSDYRKTVVFDTPV